MREFTLGCEMCLCNYMVQNTSHTARSDVTVPQCDWKNETSSADSTSFYQCNVDADPLTSYDGHLLDNASVNAHQIPSADIDMYNPELSAAENPVYFQINSLLFSCHQIRSQRYEQL